jgi:hypothetical protein
MAKIDFDRELSRGVASFNGTLGRWWNAQAMASSCFRSRVIEDVYQQTGDISDKKGGYLITTLRGI